MNRNIIFYISSDYTLFRIVKIQYQLTARSYVNKFNKNE
jgi:hypothetical protein